MIELKNTEVLGWEAAIRGARNPMNSWEKSDTFFFKGTYVQDGKLKADYYNGCGESPNDENLTGPVVIGEADHNLLMRLAKAGSVEAKYRRMIVVTVDITAPLYWWKEFDTYKVGTVANSCSTMHKIHAKEFTLDDFSHEHLIDYENYSENEMDTLLCSCRNNNCTISGLQILKHIIGALNFHREKFLKTKDKRYWWQMIQLLPSSYNQRRTVMLNYEVLANIYPNRKAHKLDEWHDFCDWIKSLPYSEIITLEE